MVKEDKRPEGVFMDIRTMTIEDKKKLAVEVLAAYGLRLGVWHIQAIPGDNGVNLELERTQDGLKIIVECGGGVDVIGGKL